MTPAFFGSEPVIAKSGKYAGTSDPAGRAGAGAGARARRSTADQRAKADPRGLEDRERQRGRGLQGQRRARLRGRAGDGARRRPSASSSWRWSAEYVGNMDDGQARVQMDEVRTHLDDTYFAWIGGSAPDSVFYYRIHSPVILIEFDHQRPANLRHLAKDPPGAHPRAHPHGGPHAERQRLRQGPAAPALRGSPARPLSPPRSAGAATGARSRSGLPRPRTARPGPGWSRSRPRPQRARRSRCCSGP